MSFHENNSLNNSVALKGPAIFFTEDMVTAAIKKMKQGKAGPSGVTVEVIKADCNNTTCKPNDV